MVKALSGKEKERRTLCGNALRDFYGEAIGEGFEFHRIRMALWQRSNKGLSEREKHIYHEVVINMSDPTYNNALREYSNYEVA